MSRSSLRILTVCGAVATSAAVYATSTLAIANTLDSAPSVQRAIDAADAVVRAGEHGLAPSEDGTEYRRVGVFAGDGYAGLEHMAYERYEKGLRVIGAGTTVTATTRGEVTDVNARGGQERMALESTDAKLSPEQIVQVARKEFMRVDAVSVPEKVIFADNHAPVVAYSVKVDGVRKMDGHLSESHATFVFDAATAEKLDTSEQVAYEMAKTVHNGTVNLDMSGNWKSTSAKGWECNDTSGSAIRGGPSAAKGGMDLETACADVGYAVENEVKMLKEWMGRDQVNGRGKTPTSQVGMQEMNAFWNGSFTRFGHNKAKTKWLTSLDVPGHEMGHAIFQYTGTSNSADNGINESTGDIFGTLTEFYANNSVDKPDYTIGEMVDLKGNGPIRVMYKPSTVGDPDCYNREVPDMEVHKAAGPQNHWFFLLAEGTNSTTQPPSATCNNSSGLKGIGIKDAGRIYLDGTSRRSGKLTHQQSRRNTLAAAIDLFRGNCYNYDAVKAAWDAVSVPSENDPVCKGPSTPPAGPNPGPTQPAPQPTQPAPWPTQPAPWPTQPAPWPTQPAPQPTQPAPWPTQPKPTQPAPKPTQPAPWPTQPAPKPTQPAPWPTQPAPQPTQPAPWPTQPAPQPTQPAPQPTRPRPTWPGMPGMPGQP